MMYFCHFRQSYVAKNKLQTAIQEYLKGKNRLIVQAGELQQFKKDILFAIENLNRAHKNCTEVKAHFSETGDKLKDFSLQLGYGVVGDFIIYSSK